jgi:hypothetical protein
MQRIHGRLQIAREAKPRLRFQRISRTRRITRSRILEGPHRFNHPNQPACPVPNAVARRKLSRQRSVQPLFRTAAPHPVSQSAFKFILREVRWGIVVRAKWVALQVYTAALHHVKKVESTALKSSSERIQKWATIQ